MTLPGSGDTTVPATDCEVPVLAQLLITSLLNSYVSPRHHSVSTCSQLQLRRKCLEPAHPPGVVKGMEKPSPPWPTQV